MKKLFVSLAAVFLCASMPFSGSAAGTPEYLLTFNLTFPPTHNRWIKAVKPWVDELEKRSGGRIRVEPYFACALSKQAEVMDSVRTGMASLGEAGYGVGIGNFLFHEQLLTIVRPSRYLTNSIGLVDAMEKAFPEVAAADWKGTHYILTHSSEGGSFIGTRDKPITSLEQIKGMKIGVPGGGRSAARLRALGATVVGIPTPDLYMSLEKGVIDGASVDMDLLVSRRLGEVIKHVTLLNSGGDSWYMTMEQMAYESLPADLKKIVDEMSGDYARERFGEFWRSGQEGNARIWIDEMGGHLHALSAEDYARADALYEKVNAEKWTAFLKEKGLPAEEMYRKFRELEPEFSVPMSECPLFRFAE